MKSVAAPARIDFYHLAYTVFSANLKKNTHFVAALDPAHARQNYKSFHVKKQPKSFY
jgi:hypothetical protein